MDCLYWKDGVCFGDVWWLWIGNYFGWSGWVDYLFYWIVWFSFGSFFCEWIGVLFIGIDLWEISLRWMCICNCFDEVVCGRFFSLF